MCCIFYQASRSGKRKTDFFKEDMFRKELDPSENRSIRPEVFLEKGVLKICSKFIPMPKRDFSKVAALLKSHFRMGVLL